MYFLKSNTSLIVGIIIGASGIYILSKRQRGTRMDDNQQNNNTASSNTPVSLRETENKERLCNDLKHNCIHMADSLEKVLNEIDDQLEENKNLDRCLKSLKELQVIEPKNAKILWMIGKAYLKISEEVTDLTAKLDNIEKGIAACKVSLHLNYKQAKAHKWMAILVGSRSNLQPLKEKILDAHLFKYHADIALVLDPLDPYLHFMVGRYCYEVASMKWYERKIAATLFAEPPTATYEEALEHLLKAERLSRDPNKEIRFYLGKCYLSMGEHSEGLNWLRESAKIKPNGVMEEIINAETKRLLKQYMY